jgi:hypothetical protein
MICPICKGELPPQCGECDQPFEKGQLICCIKRELDCHWHANCGADEEEYDVITE